MNGPISNYMVVGGINGIYLAISLLLGLELAFDVFKLRKGSVTPMMRIGGLAMLSDSLAILTGEFLFSVFPDATWLDGLSSVLDIVVEIFFVYLGIALLSGRYPNAKQRVSALVPIVLSVIGALYFPEYEKQGVFVVDFVLLVIFNHIGYQIYKRDKKLEHYYSNLDNLRSSWFMFYLIIVVLEMPLYYIVDILNAWDIRGTMCYNIIMICLYLYLARKIAVQESGLTIEQMEGFEESVVDKAEALTPEQLNELAFVADDEVAEAIEEVKAEEAKTEEPKAEVVETPKAEEPAAEEPKTEEIAPEVVEEPKAEEKAEEVAEEVAQEVAAEEPKAEEAKPIEVKAAEKVDAYLTMGQQKAFADKLRHLMEDEKAYKNPDLTVEDLKSQLHTNAAYFYYFMHDVMKMRFYEYVNNYRVEAAKRLLDEEDYTMEYIALTTGFNSYNSFVRTFKKFTGVTPSKWVAANAANVA